MAEVTSIQVPIPLDDRIKALAAGRAKRLGLSKTLAKSSYLEILVTEEEKRVEEAIQ